MHHLSFLLHDDSEETPLTKKVKVTSKDSGTADTVMLKMPT
jgi:hypothetical protein